MILSRQTEVEEKMRIIDISPRFAVLDRSY